MFIDLQKHWLEEDICARVPEGEQCLLELKLLDPQDQMQHLRFVG